MARLSFAFLCLAFSFAQHRVLQTNRESAVLSAFHHVDQSPDHDWRRPGGSSTRGLPVATLPGFWEMAWATGLLTAQVPCAGCADGVCRPPRACWLGPPPPLRV